MRILLASGSPRRKQLLEELGYDITVVGPDFDEARVSAATPEALVRALAEGKGRSVDCPADTVLVAADTVVAFEGKILGKPADPQEAAAMLRALSGNTHEVYTGVYLRRGKKEITFTDRAEVRFRNLTEQEIISYVQSGKPMDKAGSYGIQETDFVSSISGSYHNIMGFPTEKFQQIIDSI